MTSVVFAEDNFLIELEDCPPEVKRAIHVASLVTLPYLANKKK